MVHLARLANPVATPHRLKALVAPKATAARGNAGRHLVGTAPAVSNSASLDDPDSVQPVVRLQLG